MDNTRLVIAGATFYDYERDYIVIPNRTGEYCAGESHLYLNKKNYLKRYGAKQWKENKDNFIKDEGGKYYFADDRYLAPYQDLELITDLSKLIYID